MAQARRREPKQRPSRITTPKRAHPLAKLVFSEMRRQNVTYFELDMRAGVLTSTFKAWRTDNAPGLASMSAALGALGWELVPTPSLDTLPEGVRDQIHEIAQHFTSDQETLAAAIRAAKEWPEYARERKLRMQQAAAA